MESDFGPRPVSPARRNAALAALATGGFAMGLNEFVPMGLLPEMAKALRPDTWARSSAQALSSTGWVISLYALGVVVGAPTVAVATARMTRARLLLLLLGLMAVATVGSALAPSFGLELGARFLAGLPHGAYFGVAGSVAAGLLGPGNKARGYAIVLGGLTLANVVGSPLATGLGQLTGWRLVFVATAAVFGLTLAAVAVLVPELPPAPASPRAELAALKAPQVWLAAATIAVGFGGFFAVYSYIAPVTTHVAGLPPAAVPWVLATAGLGMTLGVALGGRAADRNVRRTLRRGQVATVAAIGLFLLVAHWGVGLFIAIFLLGATFLFIAPAMQARLIESAPRSQLMGAAVNQSAGNVANSVGAAVGGIAIGAGLGYLGPGLVAVLIAVVGVVLIDVGYRFDARAAARAAVGREMVAA
ncbi:MAG TPA: MFS transporter [Jatrophihabitans sp.]|jgi:DHA1 family inner membrane transport protein|uniref:MFS transporter n=1 Tax=Jatrophihabitans sp. TaxID=1932789 RepID=UPI002E083283|nr:MFS transporter [Jatrophihabitans sp.]